MMIVMFISKPFLALISDLSKTYLSRKIFLFIGFLGFLSTFILSILFYKQSYSAITFTFGVLIFLSLIDVAIDGDIIDSSSNSRSFNLKIVLALSGYSFGILLFMVMPFILTPFADFELNSWMIFQITLAILIGVISLLLFDGRTANESDLKDTTSSVKKPRFSPSVKYIKIFIIMAIGLFLYSLLDFSIHNSYLFSYLSFFVPFNEYALNYYLTPIFSILGYAGALITARVINKPKRLLFVFIPIFILTNVILIANLGFRILWIHLVLTPLISALGGFILVFLTSLMMNFSKDKMSFKFQILNIIGSVSLLLLGPLSNIWFSSVELYLLSSIIIGIFALLILIPIKIVELESLDVIE